LFCVQDKTIFVSQSPTASQGAAFKTLPEVPLPW